MPPSPTANPETASSESANQAGDTATRVLDAAEALFVEYGYAATSLRAIASRACVNLGAAHYHFGSKEGLLGAVVHRRIEPINQLRLEALSSLEAQRGAPSVREVLSAFFGPVQSPGVPDAVPRLMGRLYGEPERVSRPLIEREFGEAFDRFTAALARALPAVPEQEVRWRFHFVIGSMIHLLTTTGPPGTEPDPKAIERLIQFATAGVEQPPAPRESSR